MYDIRSINSKIRVCVGLSGGVDSSVAALLLKKAGYDVFALFMQNWHDASSTLHGDCEWEDDRTMAEMVAKKIGIPFYFVDLSKEYHQKVVDYMFDEYRKGRTPNPDVLCNREIKFDAFLKYALGLGADMVATGHYCRKETGTDGIHRIFAGLDPNKDQSYFLCQLTQEQLAYAMFPIGGLMKSKVRQLAREAHLPSAAKKDSQGICFIGKVSLPVFLQQKLKPCEGQIVEIYDEYYAVNEQYQFLREALSALHQDNPFDMEKLSLATDELLMRLSLPIHYDLTFETETYRSGKRHIPKTRYKENPYGKIIGKHNGVQFYTIGQRKGLNIGGHKDSVFVIGMDVVSNIIYVGEGHDHKGLSRSCLRIAPEDIHWIRPDMRMEEGEIRRYMVRIRYRQPLQGATLIMRANGLFILFDAPQRGITPGQFAVWYIPVDDDALSGPVVTAVEMVGSGVISL